MFSDKWLNSSKNGRRRFSKVSSLLNVLYKMTMKLIFQNFEIKIGIDHVLRLKDQDFHERQVEILKSQLF